MQSRTLQVCFDGYICSNNAGFCYHSKRWIRCQLALVVSLRAECESECSLSPALAFISVAIQVADTCRKLYDFWKSVEGAPGDVALILDDLQHLSSVLDDIAGKKMSLSPSVVAGLRCCQTRMEV